ncbi:protein-disulfide reductase DsbD family protein [Bdellovibrio bacteriovorus]|nr:thioredoxin family protein [Bdellovibrio bacteriovorus]
MRKMLRLVSVFALVFMTFQVSFASETLKGPHIQIDWLAPQIFAENSETVIGIRFRPDPHWHVYWKNPGDSGSAPKFQIKSKNAEVGEILWPYPARLPIAHLTNFGYEGDVAYLLKVKTGMAASLKMEVNLEWLVCQEECVPGFGVLSLSRDIKGTETVFAKEIQSKLNSFENKIPSAGLDSPYRLAVSELPEGGLKVFVSSKANLPSEVDLFPVDPEYVQPAQPKITKTDSGFEVAFQKSATAQKPASLGFLLVADKKAYKFSGLQIGALTATTEPVSFAVLAVILGSALLGGMLLNLMPCVFPVISIKAVSLLKNENAQERRKDGWLYAAGVLTTFAGLGAGFLILRSLGASVGWGFQLQSPLVVFGLIVLFWMMALNFLGVFEFGTAIMNSTGRIRWQGSFATGVLSVFIAAPCTGPFMGTALGATATMPGWQAMLVFIFLGMGLALPYLALTLSQKLAQKMPKPGAWMETVKQFFAFPLFATVLWLLWVLGLQTGSQGWLATGAALLILSFALWLGHGRKSLWKVIAWILAISALTYSGKQVQTAEASAEVSSNSAWTSYDENKLQSALQSGQPVFIDFTAAWCITCQVNKKAVLETATADEIFKKGNILRMRADWTKQDPAITAALSKLGRNSVPVYAFYSGKDAKTRLLPQILTIDMIHDLIPLKEEK